MKVQHAALMVAVAALASQLQAHAAPSRSAGASHGCSGPFALNMSAPAPAALSDPVLRHPWVRENVAVTFNPLLTKDGLGSQVHRLFGAYAVAACARLPYVHTVGFRRFAHFGNGSEAAQAARRLNAMLGLPNKPLPVGRARRVVPLGRSCAITWDTLVGEVRAALAAKQPTLFSLSFTYGFATAYPAMLGCVPAFRHQDRPCAGGGMLTRPLRVGVHIRAGDAVNAPERLLPHAYYFSIIRAITKELRRLQRDYVVEVYTQAAYGIHHRSDGSYARVSGAEYVSTLRANIGRHMLLLADMDVLWTLGQMSTADVFVHSKSTLSIAAGILNTKGINIAPPAGSLPWPWLQGAHWLHPSNSTGTFDSSTWRQLVSQLEAQFGPHCPGHLSAIKGVVEPAAQALPAEAALAGAGSAAAGAGAKEHVVHAAAPGAKPNM